MWNRIKRRTVMWNNDSNQIKCIYEKENIKGLKTRKKLGKPKQAWKHG